MLLPEQRQKLDSSRDALFYSYPRFVTHVDEGFIDRLTQLYRERLQPNTRILDMMSSWVSHLPPEMDFAHVEGHGMNEEELAKNPQLDHFFVQNLNEISVLPFPDQSFDAVLNCVSIQYLQYPDQVFKEMYRVLKPGGIAIVSFSNRMFFQKAIAAWREGTDQGRLQLVKRYFRSVEGFSKPEAIVETSNSPPVLQLLGMGGGDPFYAVISHRINN
ncbi:class I SAM-dependent methyltransferase [Spirulina sp. CS-785/01]|uniref:class I SAM-dependent methyltransferase n=1 Tax=Spirulina sp. CS-785/01 TaxID=3021716 RepID=UPI00232BEF6C|nr:class I SAM-dependent methyltransferase [Spirulina sp. CS-785/01]MDB9312647.1 class I SAM-dependent methyltransferase [Spirulina sp. CS-785/01]